MQSPYNLYQECVLLCLISGCGTDLAYRAICPRGCYAMPGTDIAHCYLPRSLLCDARTDAAYGAARRAERRVRRQVGPPCAATHVLCEVRYCRRRCEARTVRDVQY
eukprot:2549169-Rhodomonas_salina.1